MHITILLAYAFCLLPFVAEFVLTDGDPVAVVVVVVVVEVGVVGTTALTMNKFKL